MVSSTMLLDLTFKVKIRIGSILALSCHKIANIDKYSWMTLILENDFRRLSYNVHAGGDFRIYLELILKVKIKIRHILAPSYHKNGGSNMGNIHILFLSLLYSYILFHCIKLTCYLHWILLISYVAQYSTAKVFGMWLKNCYL